VTPPRLLLVALALVALCAVGGATAQQLEGGSTPRRVGERNPRVAAPVPAVTRERAAADEAARAYLDCLDEPVVRRYEPLAG
jgi:hypothetical protein